MNDLALKRKITGETHFESLVAQMEAHMEAVTVQNSYPLAQILLIAFTLVKNTGYYANDCKKLIKRVTEIKSGQNLRFFVTREF